MEEIMVVCKKCGNKAPASHMKLDFDLKMIVCPDCIKNKNIHKEIKEEVFHEKEEAQSIQEEPKARIAHKCTSCGYKFKINIETKIPRNCPFCNARVLSF